MLGYDRRDGDGSKAGPGRASRSVGGERKKVTQMGGTNSVLCREGGRPPGALQRGRPVQRQNVADARTKRGCIVDNSGNKARMSMKIKDEAEEVKESRSRRVGRQKARADK